MLGLVSAAQNDAGTAILVPRIAALAVMAAATACTAYLLSVKRGRERGLR